MKLVGDNLTCNRGGRMVFKGLSFAVNSGDMLVLRGRNGAGKTSLLRMIAGLNEAVTGQLELSGGNSSLTLGQQCHLIAHQEAFKPALTVAENLAFWARFFGGGDLERALGAFSLAQLAGFSGGLLSAGQKRRLALSRLVLVKRPVWLLDEPSVGLDSASTGQLRKLMRGHLDDGGIIIATTHVDLGIKGAKQLDFNTLETAA